MNKRSELTIFVRKIQTKDKITCSAVKCPTTIGVRKPAVAENKRLNIVNDHSECVDESICRLSYCQRN